MLRRNCSSLPTESWQELNPDLPITDVIPEHEELAMASHGLGCDMHAVFESMVKRREGLVRQALEQQKGKAETQT